MYMQGRMRTCASDTMGALDVRDGETGETGVSCVRVNLSLPCLLCAVAGLHSIAYVCVRLRRSVGCIGRATKRFIPMYRVFVHKRA